jgi:hypothetical protein
LDQRVNCGRSLHIQYWKKEEGRVSFVNAMPPFNMRLICTRSAPALDSESLECRQAKEALFRDGNCYVLYLSNGAPPPSRRERLISLSSREALLWLNENQVKAGSFWE